MVIFIMIIIIKNKEKRVDSLPTFPDADVTPSERRTLISFVNKKKEWTAYQFSRETQYTLIRKRS